MRTGNRQVVPRYIPNGIAQGFHIGCDRTVTFRPCSGNMPAAQQHPQLVEAHIRAEVEAGRPLPPHLASLVQTNPIDLIPKPHQPGKWRLIVDLSSPAGMSVNDAISPDWCHMQYASAVELIQQLGVGPAYRMVPVHPDDLICCGARTSSLTQPSPSAYGRRPRFSQQWQMPGSCTVEVSDTSCITWMISCCRSH